MKTLVTLLLTAALALSLAQDAMAADEYEPLPLANIDHPYQRVEQLLAAVPSGTSLDQPRFKAVMGAEVADYLDKLGIVKIESYGGTIRLSLKAEYKGFTPHNTKIHMDRVVSFTYQPNTSATFVCDNVTGISVKPFVLLGWMPLTQLTVKNDPTGNTIFSINLVTIIGTVPHKTRVSPEGKLLK
jgi:hypothetical protein